MDIDKCKKCEYCHIIRQDRFGIYLGCYKDYKGKWVVEIEKCPKGLKEQKKMWGYIDTKASGDSNYADQVMQMQRNELIKQIKADAIEEYKLKLLNAKSDLVNDIHKAKIWVEFKRQAIDIAEQLKEQK